MILDAFVLCDRVRLDSLDETMSTVDYLVECDASRDLVLGEKMWMSFPGWLAEFLFRVEPFSFGCRDFGGFVADWKWEILMVTWVCKDRGGRCNSPKVCKLLSPWGIEFNFAKFILQWNIGDIAPNHSTFELELNVLLLFQCCITVMLNQLFCFFRCFPRSSASVKSLRNFPRVFNIFIKDFLTLLRITTSSHVEVLIVSQSQCQSPRQGDLWINWRRSYQRI